MSDPVKGVMIQAFHWYTPSDGRWWNTVALQASDLATLGFTSIWLPPATKGFAGANDVGYGVYDLYDLGEFPQKGSVRTKYGTREDYLKALKKLQDSGIQVYADAVLNHRMGADATEEPMATPYAQDERRWPKGPLQKVQTWTSFHFPERQNKYSAFQWSWQHFDAVDYNAYATWDHNTVWVFEGKGFDDYVSMEKGNFAYLMGCDVDCQNPEVRNELIQWGKWYLDTTGADGFRLDAIKHIATWFFPEWLDAMEKHVGKDLFVVGEYWVDDANALCNYLNRVGEKMSVFDVPLHFNFYRAGLDGNAYDMRQILNGTVMQYWPKHAVTFVDNHDSQPLQALESSVAPWFKPLAYAIILLRQEGYPCIFWPDWEGSQYQDKGKDGNTYSIEMGSHRFLIERFLKARKQYCYGRQIDYFDHYHCIGWTQQGSEEHPKAMAVILSAGHGGSKWMDVGHAHATFVDVTGHHSFEIVSNEWGWAEFYCQGGSVSVWCQK